MKHISEICGYFSFVLLFSLEKFLERNIDDSAQYICMRHLNQSTCISAIVGVKTKRLVTE